MHLRRMRETLSRNAGMWSLLLALGLTMFVLWTLRPLANSNASDSGHDFLLLYAAAHTMRDHLNPYDPAILLPYALHAGLLPRFITSGGHQLNQPYVYPPLFAWLVIPLTTLNPASALLVWRVISAFGVFAGTYGLTAPWRDEVGILRTRARRLVFAGLVVTAPVTVYGLYWGNPVVLVYAALGGWVWLLWRRGKRTDVAAGVVMSLSLLKPQLALPLALLSTACFIWGENAWLRRARVAAGFAGAVVVLLVFDLLVTGPSLLMDWPRSISSLEHLTYSQPDMPSLLGLFQPSFRHLSSARYTEISVLIVGLTAALSFALYWLLRRVVSPMALFGLLAVLWCFGTPYAHANDDILMIPGALVLLAVMNDVGAQLARRSSRRWWDDRMPAALQHAGQYAIVGSAVVAVIGLYVGGTSQYVHYHAHHLAMHTAIALVPCILLLALGIGLLPALRTVSTSRRSHSVGSLARETEPAEPVSSLH